MTTGLIITFICFVAAELGIVVYICLIHSRDAKRYEQQIKDLQKKVSRRDRELELQEFIIETQSKMIERMRS